MKEKPAAEASLVIFTSTQYEGMRNLKRPWYTLVLADLSVEVGLAKLFRQNEGRIGFTELHRASPRNRGEEETDPMIDVTTCATN